MNEIFADIHDIMVIYIDDLMIFTKTDDPLEHKRIVKKVLQCLEEHDLFAKPEKSTFSIQEVELLGKIVSREGIKRDWLRSLGSGQYPKQWKVYTVFSV